MQDEMEKQANLNNLYLKNCILVDKQSIENISHIFGINVNENSTPSNKL